MVYFSGLGIGLSFLFGCVLLAFVGELYYLLWWKKKRDDIENQSSSSSNKTPTHLSCFRNPNSSRTHNKPQQNEMQNSSSANEDQEKEQEPNEKDSKMNGLVEESFDLELMRVHNLSGPPRFLFTINEETKEDLELESKKGSRTISLSELLGTPETPTKSSLKEDPHGSNLEGYLNPLYDVDSEFDFNKIRSSPPPTFKFLRDAEDKFLKRLMKLEEGNLVNEDSIKGKKGIQNHHDHQKSTHSQVLPLASSPSL